MTVPAQAPSPDYRCHQHGATRERWRPRPDGLEESVQFIPGYKCLKQGPTSHGRHGMELAWYLRGPAGATQFKVYSCWTPGETGHEWILNKRCSTMAADLGYHARAPQYSGHDPISDDCEIIGGPCWYDGSGLNAEELFDRFVVDGEDVIWQRLEHDYAAIAEAAGQ